jgi:sulfate permease
MGGANFSVSFAAAYGGRIISKKRAHILFLLFVFLGAVIIGKPVTETLSKKIIPPQLINLNIVLIILLSASLSIFIANLLRVPQSTSLVTVGAILGVGLYFKNFYTKTFLYLVPFWLLLPAIAYILVYYIGKIVYPPRNSNFWIYEKLVNNRKRLKTFVILASCYNAFSIGANNVANAVGPIAGAGIIRKGLGLALIAPVFGLGSFIFSGSLNTTSEKIVPLGLLTATIICLVTGTLMIIASILGVPQSFVMIKVASVFAISGLKNGHKSTFFNPVTKRTYLTWVITPITSVMLSYFLLTILNFGGGR